MPTPVAYRAAQKQLALAESLEAVANATLSVGEAEGRVARKTRDVLAAMKSMEVATADLMHAENEADDSIGMALDVKVVSNVTTGGAAGATGVEGGDFTESEPVYGEARDALQKAGASLTFGKVALQKDELRRAEQVEGGDVALAQKLARDTAETADVLHDFFLPENARAGAGAQHASAELARERARVLLLGRAARKGASPAAGAGVQQHVAALQAKVAYLNALHGATVGKESQVAHGVARLKQMNERIEAEREAARERDQTAGRIQAAWEAPVLQGLADRTSFTQRSQSRLLRVGGNKNKQTKN